MKDSNNFVINAQKIFPNAHLEVKILTVFIVIICFFTVQKWKKN